MKFTSIVSAGFAVLGAVNAAALPTVSTDVVERDSTTENLDNPAWWGKKRDSTVEHFDAGLDWRGADKKRDSTTENLDNPAWWGKKKRGTVEANA